MHLALRHRAAPARLAAIRTATPAACLAAALSLAAAWVHLAYMESHFEEWWAYGTFFLATGAGQALLAVLVLVRPRAWVLLAGIAGNAAIVGMYVLTRTNGPPLGPHARVPEVAGTVDLATTAAEVVLIGALLAQLRGTARLIAVDAILAAGVLLWALRLSGHLA